MSLYLMTKRRSRERGDALAWTILVLGVLAVVLAPLAWRHFSLSRQASASAPCSDPGWNAELIGQRIDLPKKDFNGVPLPDTDVRVIVALTCTPCAGPENLEASFEASKRKPVIVVFSGDELDVPKKWRKGDKDRLLRLILTRNVGEASKELFEGQMQVVRVNSDGTVIAIPRADQTLTDFLEEEL